MIRTQFFGEMIRVSVRKSELQAQMSELQPKSQSYSRMDPQNLNRIAPNRCLNRIFRGSAEKGLKARNTVSRILFSAEMGLKAQNTVSRVLFGEENSLSLTEFWGKLGDFCEKLGEFALSQK